MTEDSKKSKSGKCALKPLTTENILYYYMPIQGIVSYSALAVNVVNPSLLIRAFPKRDITNVLLVNTLLGSGLYLYSRPHLSKLDTKTKITYSMFGAAAFSLGSVLTWAIIRSLFSHNSMLSSACGICSGLVMIKVGGDYVAHLDSLA